MHRTGYEWDWCGRNSHRVEPGAGSCRQDYTGILPTLVDHHADPKMDRVFFFESQLLRFVKNQRTRANFDLLA